MSDINVCVACDDNYAQYAGVVIASTLKSSAENDNLHFYILDGGVTEENRKKIEDLKSIKQCEINFVKIDNQMFSDYLSVKTHTYISIPAYYRLKMASLLPSLSRIIYFDCDVVVNSSLEDLFNVEINELPFAGVRDINKRVLKKNPNYVNSGVLVMDLENIRKLDLENKIYNWTKENFDKIKMGDQEIINEVCKNQIKIVDDEWNVQSSNFTNRSSYTKNPKVIHYVARKKPWHWASFSYHRDLYFRNLQLTPWALDEKELKRWTKDNQIASLIEYVKYRPFFFVRPRFYEAIYATYLKK